MNQLRNGHGIIDLAELARKAKGMPAVVDPRLTRVKIARFSLAFIGALAVFPEGKALRCYQDEIPGDAELLGMRPYQVQTAAAGLEAGVELLFHHASFPIVHEGAPSPIVQINVKVYDVNEESHAAEE